VKTLLIKLAAALAVLSPLAASALPREVPAPVATEWRNPGNSVHVRLDRCGGQLCGTVTWASPKAIQDARRGGTTQLVGTRLFQNLKPNGDGSWSGKVFVPDIRKTFSGSLRFTDANTMVGKGCVLFGVICKSQTWSRVR
jgi:uncharacterized protein (DUF2147 family)